MITPKSAYETAAILREKEGFCSVVVSNERAKNRIVFSTKLNQYKQVASGGAVLNNVGGRVKDKMAFLKKYKFYIAFENAIFPGYVTERIIEAKQADTVPIYSGNPLITKEMNLLIFINYPEHNSYRKL